MNYDTNHIIDFVEVNKQFNFRNAKLINKHEFNKQ